MGTRNLTIVVHNKEYKIAQYCQWSGSPSCNGNRVMNFVLQNLLTPEKQEAFKKQLSKIKYVTEEEIDKRWEEAGANNGMADGTVVERFVAKHPQLDRDYGPKVLEYVLTNTDPELYLMTEFAADSLMCEWAYVIDLDNQVLEVYKGFNKKRLAKTARFAFLPLKDGKEYKQIRLLKKIPFAELKEDTMNTLVKDE